MATTNSLVVAMASSLFLHVLNWPRNLDCICIVTLLSQAKRESLLFDSFSDSLRSLSVFFFSITLSSPSCGQLASKNLVTEFELQYLYAFFMLSSFLPVFNSDCSILTYKQLQRPKVNTSNELFKTFPASYLQHRVTLLKGFTRTCLLQQSTKTFSSSVRCASKLFPTHLEKFSFSCIHFKGTVILLWASNRACGYTVTAVNELMLLHTPAVFSVFRPHDNVPPSTPETTQISGHPLAKNDLAAPAIPPRPGSAAAAHQHPIAVKSSPRPSAITRKLEQPPSPVPQLPPRSKGQDPGSDCPALPPPRPPKSSTAPAPPIPSRVAMPQMSHQVPPVSTPPPPAPPSSNIDADIARLMELGYSFEDVNRALSIANNNSSIAAQILRNFVPTFTWQSDFSWNLGRGCCCWFCGACRTRFNISDCHCTAERARSCALPFLFLSWLKTSGLDERQTLKLCRFVPRPNDR